MELENSGNTPENGWYIVDWLPRKDVNGSEFTPEYGKLYVDWLRKNDVNGSESTPEYSKLVVDRPAEYVIVEYSTNKACFAEPLGVLWQPILGGLQQSPGTDFQAETESNINPDATCIRLRKNPNPAQDVAWNFIPDDKILSTFEVEIPIHAIDGQRIYNRALAGASSEFKATSDIDPVETVNYCTEVNGGIVVKINKTFEFSPDGIKWTIKVRNVSGTVAENITVEDDLDVLPDGMSYQGIDGSLPSGWEWDTNGEPEKGKRGQLILIIDKLDPYDGNPDSGSDEGAFTFLTSWPSENPQIVNCATAKSKNGLSSVTNCSLIESLKISVKKKIQEDVTDRISETKELDFFPGDVFSYVITVENKNKSSQSVYLIITDTLDPNLEYVRNTFTVNGASVSFDAFFFDRTLNYPYPKMVDIGKTLTLEFDVKVKATAQHNDKIKNQALALPCTEWDDLSSCSIIEKSVKVSARVVDIQCDFGLQARANRSQVQLTWNHTGSASYDVYRRKSTDTVFKRIALNHVTDWATYLDRNDSDSPVQPGFTYDYYVVNSDGCRSQNIVSITPRLISDVQNTFNLDVDYDNPFTPDEQGTDNPDDGSDNPVTPDEQDADNPDDGSDISVTPVPHNINNLGNNVVDAQEDGNDEDDSDVNYTPLPPEPDPSPVPVPVYRFFSEQFNAHHFCDEVEKDYLINTYPEEIWKLEKAAFYVFRNAEQGTAPVYRLYNEDLKTHLFTIDKNEKDTLADSSQEAWTYEGVAFYVDPEYADGTVPVYRLYSVDLKTHLFTMDANEKDMLYAQPGWSYEGVAYYVYAASD